MNEQRADKLADITMQLVKLSEKNNLKALGYLEIIKQGILTNMRS